MADINVHFIDSEVTEISSDIPNVVFQTLYVKKMRSG